MFSLRGGVQLDASQISKAPIYNPGVGTASVDPPSLNEPGTIPLGGTSRGVGAPGLSHGPVVPRPGEYLPFDRSIWLTLGDGDGHQAYYRRKNQSKNSVKWGQLKLLTTEIQFLTLYWDPIHHPDPICLYVGAAPGTHLISLIEMFPWFTYHLYDPRDFDPRLQTRKNVVIHQKFFTDADAKEWKTQPNVFFICDIRTTSYERLQGGEPETDQIKNEELVRQDMANQASWVQIIQPIRAQLKFRLPYTYDFIKQAGPTRPYLDGIVYRQAWASQTSTETRLVPHPTLSSRDWNLASYEDGLFYANTQVRERFRFLNPFTNGKTPIAVELGLTNDYDSLLFTTILREYLIRFGATGSDSEFRPLAKKLIRAIGGTKRNIVSIRSGTTKAQIDDDDD
jgi:hypothetical protein